MSVATPGVTSTDPFHAEPRTRYQPMFGNGFIGVVRAGR